MSGITIVDPRGEPSRPVDPYTQRADLAAGETIGLFANGFPDSVAFLDHIGKALSQELPGINIARWDKGNASALASDDDLAEIAKTCTAVVAAYGH